MVRGFRLKRCGSKRREPKQRRAGKSRLCRAIESLEPRVVLDGAGLNDIGFGDTGIAGIAFVDSELGQDPHGDLVGPDATPLRLEGNVYAAIGSYIDSPNDVDVYQFQATGALLTVGGISSDQVQFQLYDSVGTPVKAIQVANNADVNNNQQNQPDPAADDGDGFVGCDLGPFDFCDIFPTEPGETYYVTVYGWQVTKYYYNLFQNFSGPNSGTTNRADSEIGEDPHTNQVSRAATIVEFGGDSHATIHSFVDAPGDVDVFQFRATGNWIHAFAWLGEDLGLTIEVLNRDGIVIASNSATYVDPLGMFVVDPFVDAEVEFGQHYYLRVSAANSAAGEFGIDLTQDLKTIRGDRHAEVIGDESTQLVFTASSNDDERVSTVDAYIDSVGDIDAFRWVADQSSATVSTYSWDGSFGHSVKIYDAHQNLIAQSHTGSELGDWGFVNLTVPTKVGETYYVSVGGIADGIGKYVLNVQQSVARPNRRPVADSEFGDDLHVDTAGADATILGSVDSGVHSISSFIDSPGDIDAFQFVGDGGIAFAISMGLNVRGDISIRVLDGERNEIFRGNEIDGVPSGAIQGQEFRLWATEAGATYFLEVSAADDFVGQYVLKLLMAPPVDSTQPMDAEAGGFAPQGSAPTNLADKINRLIASLPDSPNSNDRNGSLGDANLDGGVDGLDFRIWSNNQFTMATGPAHGDFNNDGAVDSSDFNIWNANRFKTPASSAAVDPVPQRALLRRIPKAPASGAAESTAPSRTDQIDSPVAPDTSGIHSNAESNARNRSAQVAIGDSVDEFLDESFKSSGSRFRTDNGLVSRRARGVTHQRRSNQSYASADSYRERVDQLFAEFDELL